MDHPFFEQPILNSPYKYSRRHWELDDKGQPMQRIIDSRRSAEFITPIPKSKHRANAAEQLLLDEGTGLSSQDQHYAHSTGVRIPKRRKPL